MEKGRNYPQTGHRWLDPLAVNNWPPRRLSLLLDFIYNGNHYSGATSFGTENVNLPGLHLFWDMTLIGLGPNDFAVECTVSVTPTSSLLCDHRVVVTEFSSGEQMITEGTRAFSAVGFPWAVPDSIPWPMGRVDTNTHYTGECTVTPNAALYF